MVRVQGGGGGGGDLAAQCLKRGRAGDVILIQLFATQARSHSPAAAVVGVVVRVVVVELLVAPGPRLCRSLI